MIMIFVMVMIICLFVLEAHLVWQLAIKSHVRGSNPSLRQEQFFIAPLCPPSTKWAFKEMLVAQWSVKSPSNLHRISDGTHDRSSARQGSLSPRST
ncbi:hypothetical protein PoB_005488400 [Plakobranchus ocellatus]|uniref:Secreted protein n=1 Tax=Plakobranchus ocellatus TaxID=259542 RepID=A0AAV4CCE1_9GAST|nr:hypothetical protein PoB_005488400 [Plakobranchus ocellatus]